MGAHDSVPPPLWTSDQALLLYSVGPKVGDDGVGQGTWGRGAGTGREGEHSARSWVDRSPERPREEGETRRDESPQTNTSVQALQRHLYVIRNALLSSTGL